MFYYELTIPDSDMPKSIDISIFPMPVLDSRMYVFQLDSLTVFGTDMDSPKKVRHRELLIIDPNLWDKDDEAELKKLCVNADHATVLVTHSHYDHIAGVNTLRELIPVTLFATELCDRKMQDSHKNLAAYSMALVMDKSEERQRYCEQYFDFDYGCKADQIFEGTLGLVLEQTPDGNIRVRDTGAPLSPNGTGASADGLSLYIRTVPTPGHSDCSQCIEIWCAPAPTSAPVPTPMQNPAVDRQPGMQKPILLAVLTGDSLVNGHDVITRFPSGSKKVFREVAEPYLRSLSDDTLILPGHGDPALYGEIKEFGII